MKKTNPAQRPRYHLIAFDLDGTLTPFARWKIPDSLLETLVEIPQDIQLTLCTGRPLPYLMPIMDYILSRSQNPEKDRKRWHIVADNGCTAYIYNSIKKQYESIYKAEWPDKTITKDALTLKLRNHFSRWYRIEEREHVVLVIFHHWLYRFPRIVRFLARRLHHKIESVLKNWNYDRAIKPLNSGLGSLIIPQEAGKGYALHQLADQLKISKKHILGIGDCPQKGENDEDFMSGDYCQAFSVGTLTQHPWPKPVLDHRGKALHGPKGTEFLLKNILRLKG